MKITIATHCWAVKHPIYATMLRAQLTSFLKNRPEYCSKIVVAADLEDTETIKVINDFIPLLHDSLVVQFLQPGELWRRCIARNLVTRSDTDSSLIWFIDCDYIFLRGCLDIVMESWIEMNRPDLIWPSSYSAREEKDDTYLLENAGKRGELDVNFPTTWQMRCSRAIGGVQIVSGEFARIHGYIPNHTKYQTPPGRPFPDTKDDAVFRRELLKIGRGEPLGTLPSLYRIRHTEVGYGLRSDA